MSLKHFAAPSPSSPLSGEGSTACRPWSREDFFSRLRTFTPFQWPIHAAELRPPECARFGWACAGRHTLRCRSCQATILTRPPPHARDIDASAARAYHERLSTMHAEKCPWRSLSCARNCFLIINILITIDAIYAVPKLSPYVARELMNERIDLLMPLKDYLPKVIVSSDVSLSHAFPF